MTSATTRLAAALGVGLCVLIGVPHLPPAAAAPGTSAGFSASPATVDPNDPLTRSYFRPVVTPGSTVGEGVIVADTGDAPVDLYVYPVDGLTGTTSGTVYGNRSDPRQKAGLWLTAGASTLTLQPHQRQLLLFVIKVPADATPGDHVAGIAFENAHPSTGTGIAVTEVIREVLGVQMRVPGPSGFHLHLASVGFSVPPAAPAASVVVRLGDDGNRLGQPVLNVTLHGPNGFTDQITRQLDTLLPGDTIDYPIVWPHPLPAGAYSFTVSQVGAPGVVLTGTAQLSSAQPGLPKTTLAPAGPAPSPALGQPPVATHSSSTSGPWLLLIAFLGGAVVFAAGAFTAVGLARRSRRSAQQRHPSADAGFRREPITGPS
jgi:hypothetical protein